MKQILLFGAGKSATVLIDYLLEHAPQENWTLTVADANLQLAIEKINHSSYAKAVSFDILDTQKRAEHIIAADIVISMLPAALHSKVAHDCLTYSKHLLTASYVDDEMRSMQNEIAAKGLLFLCEMGLDPGIDHMSAMQLIDGIHADGGVITSFKSHCGGLVAPESDNNPWHYKISWNPRNIILAGKAGALFLQEGKKIQLDYEELFAADRKVTIPAIGQLGWYPNRDSLSYAPLYGLEHTQTFIRTTLRHPDFMKGWQQLIELKLTDETAGYNSDGKTVHTLFDEHITKQGLTEKFKSILNSKLLKEENYTDASLFLQQLSFLDFTNNETLVNKGWISAADLLQLVVEKKLSLQPTDKDMIVMLHEFEYSKNGKPSSVNSSLVVKGENSLRTAMAKTVGLPLAIAAKLILNGQLSLRGLHIPTRKEIYTPVLKELENYGISFQEE